MGLPPYKKFFIFYGIDFAILLTFLSLLDVLFIDINWLVSGFAGTNINIILILYLLLSGSLLYGILLFVIEYRKSRGMDTHQIRKPWRRLAWGFLIFFDLFFAALIIGLYAFTKIIFQRIEYYMPILYGILLTALIVIILRKGSKIMQLFNRKESKADRKLAIKGGIFLGLYLFCFIMPFLLVPSIVITGPLPPKPGIIAHRGAAQIAPENTLAAIEVAANYNVTGVEIDVRISADGVPFLLHDENFFRTTDVAEIFPERKMEQAENFTIAEIKQLDAGSFFVDQDPYSTIAQGVISQAQAESYRGITVPTYAEALALMVDLNLELDLDTWIPPKTHPYYDSFIDIVLNLTVDSGIDLSKVLFPTNKTGLIPADVEAEWIAKLQARNLTQIQLGWEAQPTVAQMQHSIYNYVNTGDGYTNAQYRALNQANVKVMVWTVDAKERFSELWCLGVTWIKTNKPHEFNVDAPFWYIPKANYDAVWVVFIILGAVPLIVALKQLDFFKSANKVSKTNN